MYLLITESTKGSHVPPSLNGKVLVFSTGGSRGIVFNPQTKSYYVQSSARKFIKDLWDSGKIKGVLVGTDLDHVGTKIATVYREFLENEGIPSVRTAFTSKGYLKVGGFYAPSQMRYYALIDNLNVNTARFFREAYGINNFSAQKGIVVAKAKNWKGRRVPVRKGTNTVTALINGLMQGKSASAVKSHLQRLYYAGSVEYPRVDVDYFSPETAYDVYAHPPLTANGYKDSIVKEIEKESLEANTKTVVLGLAEQRFLTPSTCFKYQELIEEFYHDDLTPKEEYKQVIKEAEAIANEVETEYRMILSNLSPKMPLYSVPEPPSPKGKGKDDEVDEWFTLARQKEKESIMEYLKRQAGNSPSQPVSP